MKFAARDHLFEAGPLVRALVDAGHELVAEGPTDLFLVDFDCDQFGYRPIIDFYRECGAVILQYPHGAGCATMQWDCFYEPYSAVDGQLTPAQGEIDFMRVLGVDRPARIMGWSFCRQFEFRGTENPKRVVFAPAHVNAAGDLDVERCEHNAAVFRRLLDGPWELVVRYVGELERLGLWEDERVFRWVPGDRDMTTVEIDSADCVVSSYGTYPTLAVARGVPAVMYSQFRPYLGLPDEPPLVLRNLEKYRDLVRYPLDAEDGDLTELIYRACRDEDAIRDWRKAWVGEPFDPAAFVKLVEAWVPDLRALRDDMDLRAEVSPV